MFMNFRSHFWKLLSPPWCEDYVWQKMRLAMRRGFWSTGPRAKSIERHIARELDVDPSWVVATRSATVALESAYRFLLDEKEEVRVSPLTFVSTYSGAVNAGLPIRWVDVDDAGYPLSDVDVAVDLWGRPHRLASGERGTPALVDAAHRCLAPEHGDLVRQGTAIVYSFDLRKEVSCIIGGAIVSPRIPTTYLREWLHFGLDSNRIPIPGLGGTNGGLPDPIAAQALEGLKRLNRSRTKRQRTLDVYHENFGTALLSTPPEASGHVAVLRTRNEGETRLIRSKLDYHRVQNSCHYPVPTEYGCPSATALAKRLITLPCHVYMKNPSDPLRVARIVTNA